MNATGLLAGAVGTAVLSVFECLESVALGQRLPVYAAANVGGMLARRWFPGVARSRSEMRFGYLLRALYGPSLGVLFMHLRARLPRPPIIAGVCFAAGVFAGELARHHPEHLNLPRRQDAQLAKRVLSLLAKA